MAVELLFQKLIQDAKREYDQGHGGEAEELLCRAIVLAAEETARAYHQHFLAKIESYWNRLRESLGYQKLAVPTQLRQAQADSAAETSRIPTARTVYEIYAEAWATFNESTLADSSIVVRGTVAEELPCWMTTRRRLPPKNGWSNFVFDLLFCRSKKPTWDRLHFLQVYRSFKNYWENKCKFSGHFDSRFSAEIGRYIQVTFNSDHSKEVGTNHNRGTLYHDKPAFFQIQYWAPYFSPPRKEGDTPLSAIYRQAHYPDGLSPSTTPTIPCARDFQDIESSAWEHWSEIMIKTNQLRSSSRSTIQRHCRRALLYATHLAGPTWGRDGDVNFIQPWSFKRLGAHGCGQDEDVFRVPVSDTHISNRTADSAVCQPTILFPTRDNLVGLLDTIESFSGHSAGFKARLRWTRRRLHNDGQQYDVRSHLVAKLQSVEDTAENQNLLQQFLRQSKPPERDVELQYGSGDISHHEEENQAGWTEEDETETGESSASECEDSSVE